MKKNILIIFAVVQLGLVACGKSQPLKPKAPAENVSLNLDTTNILIGVYWPPLLEFVNDQQFKLLEDGHVDILQYVVPYTQEQNLKILDLSAKYHLSSIIADARVNGTNASIAAMVAAYKHHKGLAGYYIKDEPTIEQLEQMAGMYKALLAQDPAHIPHVNLNPVYATGMLAGRDYEKDYVEKWIQLAGAKNLKSLSFDNYLFMDDGTLREAPYYQNLDIIRRLGIKYNIKTSAYLQSVGIPGAYRRPNQNELRFNMYSILAYGVKYPVWFTYTRPADNTAERFTPAILNTGGQITDLYEPFKRLNKEAKTLGKQLVKLQATAVYHTGAVIPQGAETLPGAYYLQPAPGSGNLLIAQMQDPSEGNRSYAMVVNKSLADTVTVTFNVHAPVTAIEEVSKLTGTGNPLPVINGKIAVSFAPGEGRLFRFNGF
ncbi:hypothetical protein [Niabella drilacis]|uniref:Beta-galactosidase n=1 Tax=Niabella drilacis (strain DSM 25811 / CCM 8410 / CCUG 62505 / LMG 26954 / E90) TaxID=1285928 RepID=A0A1G6MW15_NIADE|nr:hypothetical protein [Niabella drilacis]SDC59397.1 hypothetical protein SAMN04487894_10351 [Niabella drilacis]